MLGAVRRSRTRPTATRCCRPAVTARVSVEAGITFGWEKWIGPRGKSVGIDRFGASAPGKTVARELGISPEAVVAAVREVAGRDA